MLHIVQMAENGDFSSDAVFRSSSLSFLWLFCVVFFLFWAKCLGFFLSALSVIGTTRKPDLEERKELWSGVIRAGYAALTDLCVCLRVCLFVCMFVCMSVCVSLSLFVCLYMCVLFRCSGWHQQNRLHALHFRNSRLHRSVQIFPESIRAFWENTENWSACGGRWGPEACRPVEVLPPRVSGGKGPAVQTRTGISWLWEC